jgi:nitric oxide dioxygenase
LDVINLGSASRSFFSLTRFPDSPPRYSLSENPSPDHYRISVKREAGLQVLGSDGKADTSTATHPGFISNLLHDTVYEGHIVEVAYPFGEFFLEESDGPVVLVSAGVGVTPLLAMLETLAGSKRRVSWIQSARSERQHAFRARVRELAQAHSEQITTTTFYSAPADARLGVDFDVQGRVDLDKVPAERLFLEDATAHYYTCGPEAFMQDIVDRLKKRGVDASRLHAEVFGAGSIVL